MPTTLALAMLAAALGSGINSIAGGGTLVTFPAIVALGVPPLVANATNTVALWPGALASMWGYRDELAGTRAWLARFTLPSLLGGAVGGWLLLATGQERFARIVPFLVLGATGLFMLHGPVMRWLGAGSHQAPAWLFLVCQFAVGIYGGYFGAGIGILMLAVLGLMGHTNIHQMNGLKNWGGLCINFVAALIFAVSGVVLWPLALAMAVGGVVGGYAGARLAQRVGQEVVRRAVVVIGLAAFVWLLARPL
ncbi:MAG: sulfite exporter TauE/SafE family protein [bacterium]